MQILIQLVWMGLRVCIFFFWLLWVFVAVRGLLLVVVSGGYCSCRGWASHHSGFSCCRTLALERRLSSCAQGLSCPKARGIFPDQGLNPVPCIGRQILNHWSTREVPRACISQRFPEAAQAAGPSPSSNEPGKVCPLQPSSPPSPSPSSLLSTQGEVSEARKGLLKPKED